MCLSHLGNGLCQVCINDDDARRVKALNEAAAVPYVRAVSQATERRLAAIRELNDLGAPGLVSRRMRVGTDYRRFGRNVDHYDVYEGAWPVGDISWRYHGMGWSSGDMLSRASGVTPRNQVVAMAHPLQGEVPVEKASTQTRSGPGSVGDPDLTVEVHEMIATALEELVKAHSPK